MNQRWPFDPQSRNSILEGLSRLNQQGTTIVYTSHYMEEVEQLCSRIVIMDRGKVIANGTKDELKAMINTGETISVELFVLPTETLEGIRQLPHVSSVEYSQNRLTVRHNGGSHNLITLLDYLKAQNLSYGRIYSQQPTLNDVFLEITGRHLRDAEAM
jgi:ABC-2 type transport system ATP-binding protein